ncbi:MAG: bifunctional 4-hydroxy-2-oxoglutarate aldolase/2-dehydro-3-deoxy-phosphogluconate aldolase [Gammaproteobacteria bacterium]|nr:bifunctional 4-hydroxy-2-oxoglutarate aldolase/2-dehydro-3-deoxy-phosphogluconate aldolase [Gammaproteobacteria bacterium]
MTSALAILQRARLMPVVTINRVEEAKPLADALEQGGIDVVEVTLRTDASLGALEELAKAGHPTRMLGAGTVLSAEQAQAAVAAGAEFLVSPGMVEEVHAYCRQHGVPYLPGIATVTEALSAAALGYDAVKVFPAGSVGGPRFLEALASVLPNLAVCPTGGINADNLADYARVANVVCVGGSWIVPQPAIRQGNFQEINKLSEKSLKVVQEAKRLA